LYGVAFPISDLWGGFGSNEKMYIDIYEHWLEPG